MIVGDRAMSVEDLLDGGLTVDGVFQRHSDVQVIKRRDVHRHGAASARVLDQQDPQPERLAAS